VPKVSIVALLTGDEEAEDIFAESVKAQVLDDFELVCVTDSGHPAPGERLAGLATSVVAADGGAGNRRNAALPACTGEYVLFTDTETKLSPALVQSLAAQIEGASKGKGKEPPQVVVFHAQRYDVERKTYLTRRMSTRRAMSIEPYAPVFHAGRVFQRLGAGTANKAFSRSFLEECRIPFSALAAHDDDTGAMRLLARAERVISTSFPLSIAKFNPAEEACTLGPDGSMGRLEDAVALVEEFDTEGQTRAFLPSALEWLVGSCVTHLDLLDGNGKERFMDDMREVARPVVERLATADMKPHSWGSYDRFAAACLDRLELFERCSSLAEDCKERDYERARLELMAQRLRAAAGGAETAEKPKRRGLFRR